MPDDRIRSFQRFVESASKSELIRRRAELLPHTANATRHPEANHALYLMLSGIESQMQVYRELESVRV